MKEFRPESEVPLKQLELSSGDMERIDVMIQKALQIDAHELAGLREKIAKNNGLIRAFVHPFYAISQKRKFWPHVGPTPEELKSAHEFVEVGALRHIRSAHRHDAAPLILFEEHHKVTDVRKEIADDSNDFRSVYVIPTEKGSGLLQGIFSEEVLAGSDWESAELQKTAHFDPHKHTYHVRSSDHLVTLLLVGLGVKKILVGGMYMDNDLGICMRTIIKPAKQLRISVTLSKYHIDGDGRNIHGKKQAKDS